MGQLLALIAAVVWGAYLGLYYVGTFAQMASVDVAIAAVTVWVYREIFMTEPEQPLEPRPRLALRRLFSGVLIFAAYSIVTIFLSMFGFLLVTPA